MTPGTAAPSAHRDLAGTTAGARPGAANLTAGCHRPGPISRAAGSHAIVCMASTPDGQGYWLVGAGGAVFTFGDARYYGGPGGQALAAPVVGMAPTPDGRGYWLAGADGGVFAFGDATYRGGLAGRRLAAPVVGITATPDGGGYWLVSSDGGVFAFGDAVFHGGMGGQRLRSPVVGLTVTADGAGYWLVAADGGVFTYGTAPYLGSMGGRGLRAPVVGLVRTTDGSGYWLVSSDGGVFTYGTAPYLGSIGGRRLAAAVVGMAPSPRGGGYWLVAADGGVFTYGGAPYEGSTWSAHVARPIMDSIRSHGPRVAVFYYPWYSAPPLSGAWRHWNQGGHRPPKDIGSDFFPARGAYDSSDPAVLAAQMAEISRAGIDEVVVSWWGRGSFEDHQLAQVAQAAAAHGLAVAVHLEPYRGRSAASVVADIAYLRATYGTSEYFVYQADAIPANDWSARHRLPGVTLWATGDPDSMRSGAFEAWAAAAGFQGVYTYDGMNFDGAQFPAFCAIARRYSLGCSPSVAPGFEAVRATGGPAVRPRADGATYDSMWQGALAAEPDLVTITSYNEWHEGTQIEPARSRCVPGYCYSDYQGAYGRAGEAAQTAYLDRTRYWIEISRR